MAKNIIIPTRQRIGSCEAQVAGDKLAENIMCSWGLPNAKKIVNAMKNYLARETKRRKDKK